MATQNKKVNIITDANFNGNKIENAVINSASNTFSGVLTSARIQATSPVQSSTSTTQTATLDTTISLASGYGDTQNPYETKNANYVLAAPNGSSGVPVFRALVKADIPLASETAASGGTTTSLVTTGEKYTWNNKQSKNLYFTDVIAANSNWVSDSTTYPDYSYKCTIIGLTGVTADMFAIVVFGPTEFDSGNYANVCETGSGSVTIWSKVNSTITIPTIVVMGA